MVRHYCNGSILIKLRSPDREANMFFTVKDKFPALTAPLSSQIIRMDGGEYVSLAGEFNGLKEVIFFFFKLSQSDIYNGEFSLLYLLYVYLDFICQVTKEEWAMMESMIRSTKGS